MARSAGGPAFSAVERCRVRNSRSSAPSRFARSRIRMTALELRQPPICLRPTIAEELPDIPDLANLVEVELGGDQLGLVPRPLRDELAAWIAEIALAVEL